MELLPLLRPLHAPLPDEGTLIAVLPMLLLVLLGAWIVIIGLTPALLNSVELSGIVPPFSAELVLEPGVDRGDAVPPEDKLGEDVQSDAEAIEAGVVSPPPSKVEQVVPIAVLTPPGSISVAPRGMPVLDAPEPLDPGMPSGEVAPDDSVLIVCA
ncbi:hypothetical protein [Mesorhizobium argentiipisi]|uniref:Uncharacterized protein n=1 Tax=Mesorhizobium argentiipisi TaxID=3015175 RepID=A0ABU8K7Y0_9HYPH